MVTYYFFHISYCIYNYPMHQFDYHRHRQWDCFCIPQSIVQSAALTLLLCPVLLPGGLPGRYWRNILFHHLRISSDKAIFPPLASHNFGSRPHGQKNNAGISALQGSGPWPLLPALSFPMAGMDFLQYHARMLGHGKVPGAYWDGPFSFRGRTAVDTPGIPALLHLLQQNTIHLPADSIRPGNRGHFHSLHHTPDRQFSVFSRQPQYCRFTPAECFPFLHSLCHPRTTCRSLPQSAWTGAHTFHRKSEGRLAQSICVPTGS